MPCTLVALPPARISGNFRTQKNLSRCKLKSATELNGTHCCCLPVFLRLHGNRQLGLCELTGAGFVATITPGLSGSEASVGATNSELCDANVEVAVDTAVRNGTIGPF